MKEEEKEPTFEDYVMRLREFLSLFPNEQCRILGCNLAMTNMLAYDPELIDFLKDLSRHAEIIRVMMDSDQEWNEKGLH